MDKTIPQLDAAPSTLPENWVLAISDPAQSGVDAMKVPLSQLKEAILNGATQEGLKVFYVDAFNTIDGDGSILNPFSNLLLAYNKVLGSGTPDEPEIQDVAIKVAAGVYSFSGNIFLKGVSILFEPNATVNFSSGETGDYFIDTLDYPNVNKPFRILGGLNLNLSSGGFIRNHGTSISQMFQKVLEIEVNDVYGTTPVISGDYYQYALISVKKTTPSGGYSAPTTYLTISGRVISVYQALIDQRGSVPLYIKGVSSVASLEYMGGIDGVDAGTTSNMNAIRYNNDESGDRKDLGMIVIEDCKFRVRICKNIFHFEGYLAGRLNNLSFYEAAGTANNTIERFIELGNVQYASYQSGGNLKLFEVNNVFISRTLIFNQDDIIKWVGTTATQNKLDMRNSYISSPYYVNENVDLGGNEINTVNIISNTLTITKVKEYADNATAIADNMKKGMVYRTADVLKVVH